MPCRTPAQRCREQDLPTRIDHLARPWSPPSSLFGVRVPIFSSNTALNYETASPVLWSMACGHTVVHWKTPLVPSAMCPTGIEGHAKAKSRTGRRASRHMPASHQPVITLPEWAGGWMIATVETTGKGGLRGLI